MRASRPCHAADAARSSRNLPPPSASPPCCRARSAPRCNSTAPKITDGDFSGHATIPAGKTLTIKAGATIHAETGASILGWPTSGGGSGGESATAPKFALFEIPLGIHGAEWTDFELKGSINNFTGLAAEALCYFYGSAYGNGQSTHGRIGRTIAVYYTDDLGGAYHGIARKWQKQEPAFSIFEQKFAPNSRIGGVLVVVPIGGEIRPDNEQLRFIWQRVSAARMEQCWVPVTPKWAVAAPLGDEVFIQPPDGDGKGGGTDGTTWDGVYRIAPSMEDWPYPLTVLANWGDYRDHFHAEYRVKNTSQYPVKLQQRIQINDAPRSAWETYCARLAPGEELDFDTLEAGTVQYPSMVHWEMRAVYLQHPHIPEDTPLEEYPLIEVRPVVTARTRWYSNSNRRHLSDLSPA